jgi:hypothetical protein
MVQPCIEAQAELFEPRESSAKLAVTQQPRARFVAQSAACVPRRRLTNAAKPARAGCHMRFEHSCHAIAQRKISEADDGRGNSGSGTRSGSNPLRDAVKEFGLTNRLQAIGSMFQVTVAAFNRDRADNVMPCAKIVEKILEQVAVRRSLPQMMMGIANR